MSFTDPGFEEMSFNELKDWLAGNDLSSASYAELLDQLGVDLPAALPGVVQSSLGGSSGSVSTPAQGTTLVWDSNQQLYVPGSPLPPVGVLVPTALASLAGCLLCDGTTYPGSAYPILFANIDSAYISGSNFRVPDLRGRVPAGAGTGTASGATAWSLGQEPTSGAGGEQTHTLTLAEMPPHAHNPNSASSTGFVASGTTGLGANVTTGGGGYIQTDTDTQGGGGAHNNMPPTSFVNWFIVHG